jgi:hypothetical protein
MKKTLAVRPSLLIAGLLFLSVAAQSRDPGLNRDQARKLSTSFINDLVANRIDAAAEKYWVANVLGREKSKAFLEDTINKCGKPLKSEPLNNGLPVIGESITPDGKKKSTMAFLYLSKKSSRAQYRFTVEIELANNGKYIVGGVGCGPMYPLTRPISH